MVLLLVFKDQTRNAAINSHFDDPCLLPTETFQSFQLHLSKFTPVLQKQRIASDRGRGLRGFHTWL